MVYDCSAIYDGSDVLKRGISGAAVFAVRDNAFQNFMPENRAVCNP